MKFFSLCPFALSWSLEFHDYALSLRKSKGSISPLNFAFVVLLCFPTDGAIIHYLTFVPLFFRISRSVFVALWHCGIPPSPSLFYPILNFGYLILFGLVVTSIHLLTTSTSMYSLSGSP